MTAAVPRALYPFESQFLDIEGLKLHYLDEGEGSPVLMVHGNPTWSFFWRRLVKDLRGEHRVIVPDHIGCGLSDKPGDDRYSYTLERRVQDLEALTDALGLTENITLIVHDWGGMIGMAFAARHPERIKRIVLFNTAAFHLPEHRPFHWQLRLVRNSQVGAWLVTRFNAFAATAARTCTCRHRLDPQVKAGLLAPYDSPENRIATLRFVQDIPLEPSDQAYAVVSETADRLELFGELPMLILWGQKDFVFDEPFLLEWERRFPDAEVHRFADCGHYLIEDAPDEVSALVTAFLAAHPLPGEGE